MKRWPCVGLVLGMFILVACESKHDSGHWVTATLDTYQPTRTYSGVIVPKVYRLISSPIEGHVSKLLVPYGSWVKDTQPVIQISDPSINENYINAVVDFLDKKEKQRRTHLKFEGEQSLFKAGVISKNDLENDQYEADAARIAFLRAAYTLKEKSRLIGVDYSVIEQMTLHQWPQTADQLLRQMTVNVHLPVSGRWMSPLFLKSEAGSDVSAAYVGKKVEKGQSLGAVIETDALQAKLLVDYSSLSLLKVGQAVQLHSDILGDHVHLTGQVEAVRRFDAVTPESGHQGSLMFPVIVKVNPLPKALKSSNILGISVRAKILLPSQQQLRIPMNAIHTHKGQLFVKRKGALKAIRVPVQLGYADLEYVEVREGLKAGDKVWVSD